MNLLAIGALFAVTTVPITMPRATAPIVASPPAVAVQMRNPNLNVYAFFARQMQQEPSPCRLRAFFGNDAAKPLETVYFARPGSPCGGLPFYGFVYLTR
jgi:hypothetical protein